MNENIIGIISISIVAMAVWGLMNPAKLENTQTKIIFWSSISILVGITGFNT